ncbi:MAG: FtsX-like permease family protein [Phycisphaerales bacterium]
MHIALSGLSGRRGRTALLAAAVLLASTLVVAVACGIGSARASIEARLHRIIGATDARIIEERNNRFDASLVDDVREWPGVAAAGARLFSSVTVLNANAAADDGSPRRGNLQVRGIDLATLERFGQVDISRGRLPQRDDEIALDAMGEKSLGAELGHVLRLQRFGPSMNFTVVGFYGRPALGMLQRAEAVMSRAALEEASGRAGEASVVSLILDRAALAAAGLDVPAWCKANQHRLPDHLVLEPAEMITTGYDRQVRASNLGFVLASMIAFLSCAFIVATGMTTAVVEQQRLMAVARCIGASRPQLFAAQVVSGAIVCGAGGLLGVPAGILLAWLLVRRFGDALTEGLAVEPLGILLAVGGALAAGVAGSLYPAWRCARVSPLAALAARSVAPTRRGLVACALAGAACAGAAALVVVAVPDVQRRFWAWILVGLPLVHVGWFLLSVPALLLMTWLAAPIVGRAFALPRGLLRSSVLATPFRAGFTAGALMVGMSVLVSTWSNGISLLEDWFGRMRFADGFVFRATGVTPREEEAIAGLPFVEATCPIGYLPLRVVGAAALGVRGLAPPNVICIGFDPERFFAMTTLTWQQGTPEEAIPALVRGDGILVAEQFLVARGLGVGDTIRLASGRGEHDFRIVGVVNAAGLDIATQWFGIGSAYTEHAISCVFMDYGTVKRLFGSAEPKMIQLKLAGDISDERAAARLAEAVPGLNFSSGRAIRHVVEEIGATMLAVSTGVAVAALLLGCFGVGNVIAAGIHARRHEFGVLRAVGGSAWTPARLVCAEAALIALAGALSGTLLGMQLAWASVLLHRDLLGLPMRLVFPALPAAAGWVTVLLLAIASALPAAWVLARRSPRELLATGRGG